MEESAESNDEPIEEPREPASALGVSADNEPDLERRRDFLSKAVSIVTGGVIVAVPVGAGIGTLLSPLSAEKVKGLKVRLAGVGDLPADGTPKRFDVVTQRKDAWTKYPTKAIGSVWLRKLEDGSVVAFNTTCPHLGCSVDFNAADRQFACPCHASAFKLDGSTIGDSVSPRGMDTLEIDAEALAKGDVVVTFMNFKPTMADKLPA